MPRLEELKQKVAALYAQKNSDRDEWADWLYPNHVVVVTENAERLAELYDANAELAAAAAVLHDVADAVMAREKPEHEKRSIELAMQLLEQTGFTREERDVVADALRLHSCRTELPHSLEGRVMAAADGLAHVATDFYDFAIREKHKEGETDEQIRAWGMPKIDRDYYKKISFDDLREEVAADYERVKALFEAL